MVTPRSPTCSLGIISCPLMLRHSVFFLLSPKNIILNFEGLALMPLAVYHSNTSCRSLSNLITIESIFESQVIYSISSLVRQAYFGTAVLVEQHNSSTALFQAEADLVCRQCLTEGINFFRKWKKLSEFSDLFGIAILLSVHVSCVASLCVSLYTYGLHW